MTRIRVALVFSSLVALGLVALLAWRANDGLAAERAQRHEAVAERAFEEMERTLTEFLAREEARPFEHYAFYLPRSGERSPLASAPAPFVVGAFQIDPEGAVTTPLEPLDADAARARGDWPAPDAVRVAAGRVRAAVNALWSANEVSGRLDRDALRKVESDATEHRDRGAGERQAPGTTRAVAGPGVERLEQRSADRESELARSPGSAYAVLESLNRAADERAERKQKVASAPSAAVYGATAPAPSAPPAQPAATPRARAMESAGEPSADASERLLDAPAPLAESDAPRAFDAFEDAAAAAPAPRRAGAVRIALDPMVSAAAGADALVLYRTVLVGERGFRQGLVLDRAALGAWLDERVIRASGLASVASVHFDGGAPDGAADRYVFAHRFAEPFDALHAQLHLASLPGVASPGALYALVAVLLAVGAAGLFAVHRTAAVVMHYAERRSNFAAAVTHELKTPLTSIRMYAEMLRDGLVPGDAKRHEYYRTITDESERLSRLVDNVLEFSKLEAGRRELAIAAGAVGPVLEEAAGKLAPHAAREGFSLSVRVAPDLPAVRFDRDALLQVLFNLVDNAMKYAVTATERTVEIEARRDGDAVTVAVRDFGPGVARAHLERVFEPFYRGESELTRTAKGTGIGLALVRELALRMGAAVGGANADGGGFRVSVAFPIPRS